MNNGVTTFFLRGVLALTLLAPAATAPSLFAQNQQPGSPPGAPHSWQGRPGGMPPRGTPPQGTQPQRMPAVGTPGGPSAVHPAPPDAIPGKKTPAGEQFFIVASIDLQKAQLLLKYPTEVTVLMHVDSSTKLIGDSGHPLKLSDFRAGDTVWVSSANSKGEVAALRVRKGRMDVADLHRYYLDYAEIK
jgi:hypothetical protein